MEGDAIEYVKDAVLKGIGALDESTTFAVVAFDETASVVIRPQPATSSAQAEAQTALHWLHASGGTAFSTGLLLARSLFVNHSGAICRAIFLTDGNKRPSDPAPSGPRSSRAWASSSATVGVSAQSGRSAKSRRSRGD